MSNQPVGEDKSRGGHIKVPRLLGVDVPVEGDPLGTGGQRDHQVRVSLGREGAKTSSIISILLKLLKYYSNYLNFI